MVKGRSHNDKENRLASIINLIPVELWNDINRQGRGIMARIEFLRQI